MFCPAEFAIGRMSPEKIDAAAIENNNVLITGTDKAVNKMTELFVGFTNPLMINPMNNRPRDNLIITTKTLPQDKLARAPENILSVADKMRRGRMIKAATNSDLTSFLYSLNIHPAINPANPVLVRQTKIVPIGVYAKKKLIVEGAVNTIAPSTKPRNSPPIGPYNIAPTAIGNKDNVMEIGPN